MTSPTTYRGNDAAIQIGGKTHRIIGISDFTLTLDRGTVEEPLVGELGNYFLAGSLSATGSFTAAKLDNTAAGTLMHNEVKGDTVWISGSVGPNSLSFFFEECLITGYDVTIGDADTVTEASIDFSVKDPQNIKAQALDTGGVQIGDAL